MRIIDLEKRIGDFHLKIDDLTIEQGKIHGFLGANGSGKTTAAKLIMDIISPVSYTHLTLPTKLEV